MGAGTQCTQGPQGRVDDELGETWPSDQGGKGNLNVPPAVAPPPLGNSPFWALDIEASEA